jgi:acyl-CoA thioester hydrolase
MKPKPFKPQVDEHNEQYVRDYETGLVWYRSTLRTLYADTDRSTVVYHANYLRYFEVGRTSLMRDAAYSYRIIEETGYVYPIIEVGVKFYEPLYYDDVMWIHTRPSEIERVKLRFDYMITNAENERIICSGFTRHCALNSAGTVVAIDPKTIQLWKNFPK